MVTYMETQTAPSYMSVTCARRTLRKPNCTRATHTHPSLSNIPKWDSNFGEPTHSRGTTRLGQNFSTSPKIKKPNLHIVRYTCQFERDHPSWAPTKEPTVSCWRYTPTPKQDRFQDLLEAIFPDFQHTTLPK